MKGGMLRRNVSDKPQRRPAKDRVDIGQRRNEPDGKTVPCFKSYPRGRLIFQPILKHLNCSVKEPHRGFLAVAAPHQDLTVGFAHIEYCRAACRHLKKSGGAALAADKRCILFEIYPLNNCDKK